jgi:hypothetical protein
VQIAIKLATSSTIFQKLRNSLTGTSSTSAAFSGAEQLQLRSSEGRGVMQPMSNVPSMPEVAEDEVLENERFMPFQGFKSSHLMGLDPKRCRAIFCGVLNGMCFLTSGVSTMCHFVMMSTTPGIVVQVQQAQKR